MLPSTPHRSAVISYAAGLAAIAGLMAVVALGGNMVTPKRSAIDPSIPQVTAAKLP
jgi:hypothetical protein